MKTSKSKFLAFCSLFFGFCFPSLSPHRLVSSTLPSILPLIFPVSQMKFVGLTVLLAVVVVAILGLTVKAQEETQVTHTSTSTREAEDTFVFKAKYAHPRAFLCPCIVCCSLPRLYSLRLLRRRVIARLFTMVQLH